MSPGRAAIGDGTATETRVASRDGTEIAFWTSDNGSALVLVHGTSADHWSFRLVGPLLAGRFTVHAVDRRGRGRSGDSEHGYTIEQEFADIAAAVDSLPKPAVLLGHSYGATVALGTAPLTQNLRSLSRVVVLDGQGHVALMTAPELFADEVISFLGDA